MHRLRRSCVILCIGLVALSGCGNTPEPLQGSAAQFVAEAAALVAQGQEAETTDVAAAARLYQAALRKIAELAAAYPSAPVVLRIQANEEQIGPFTVAELRDQVLPRLQWRAEAETDPLAYALLLVSQSPTFSAQGFLLVDIARTYAEIGQAEKARQIALSAGKTIYAVLDALVTYYVAAAQFDHAWALVESGENEEIKDWGRERIARLHLENGQLEEALAAARTIADPTMKTEVLIDLANRYTAIGQDALRVDWLGWRTVKQWSIVKSPRWVTRWPYDTSRAAEIAAQARQEAAAIEEFPARTAALFTIAQSYAAAGRYEAALAIVISLREPERKARGLLAIAAHAAATGQGQTALPLLEQALEIVKAILDPAVRTAMTKEVARIFLDAGRDDGALRLASTLKDPLARTEITVAVARKLAAGGEQEKAVQLAQTITENASRARLLTQIAQTYAAAGQEERARALASEAERDLSAFARGSLANGQFDQARQVALAIGEATVRAEVLTEIACALLTAGQEDQGAEALASAENAVETIDEAREQEAARAMMARKLAASGHQARARQAALAIRDAARRVTLLLEAAEALSDAGLLEAAESMLALAVQTAKTLRESEEKSKLLVKVARRLLAAGRISQVDVILSSLKDAAMRDDLMEALARFHLEAGRYEEAARTANGIRETFTQARTFAALARKAMAEGQDQLAWQYALHMTVMSERDSVLNALAGRFLAAGRYEDALKALTVMKSSTLKSRILIEVARAYMTTGQEQRAVQLLSETTDAFTRANLMAEMARGYALQGRLEEALRMARAIADGGVRERTLRRLAKLNDANEPGEGTIETLLTANASDLTARVRKLALAGQYEQAQSLATTIPDPALRAPLLGEIARRCFDAQRAEQAATALSQAVQTTRQFPDPAARTKTFAALARQMLIAGRVSEAAHVAARIEDQERRADVLTDVARAYLEADQDEQAIGLARTITAGYSSAKIFAALARKYLDKGEWRRALTTTRDIGDQRMKARLLIEIARDCEAKGEHAGFEHALTFAVREAESLENPMRHALLADIARAFLAGGRVADVLRITRSLQNITLSDSLLADVAKHEAREGKPEAATRAADAITEATLRDEALTAIAYAYVEQKDYDRAFATGQRILAQEARAEVSALIASDELPTLRPPPWGELPSAASQAPLPPADGIRNADSATLARRYMNVGRYDRASLLVTMLASPEEKPLLFAELAARRQEKGEEAVAEEIFAQALQDAAALPAGGKRNAVLTGIGITYAHARRNVVGDKVQTTLREMMARTEGGASAEKPSGQ